MWSKPFLCAAIVFFTRPRFRVCSVVASTPYKMVAPRSLEARKRAFVEAMPGNIAAGGGRRVRGAKNEGGPGGRRTLD